MLLAYVDDLSGNQTLTLPYYIEDGIAGGGDNFVTTLVIRVAITDTSTETQGISASGSDNIEYTLDIDYGIDNDDRVFINIGWKHQGHKVSNTGTDNVEYTIDIDYGVDHNDRVFINVGVTETATSYQGTQAMGTENINYSIYEDIPPQYNVYLTIGYEITESSFATSGTSATGTENINQELVISWLDYEWAAVSGQEPTVDQTCII